MDLSGYLSKYRSELVEWGLYAMGSLDFPFDNTGDHYLDAAERDLEHEDNQGNINALANAKRAIDVQIEALIKVLGLKKESSFPGRVERLKEIGVVAPRILNKVNKVRNTLEHEFKSPERAFTEDAVDVATLFVKLTNEIFFGFYGQVEYEQAYAGRGRRPHELGKTATGVRITFEETWSGFHIEGYVVNKKPVDYRVKPGMPEHVPLMKLFIGLRSSEEDPFVFLDQAIEEIC
ncbi:DUF4145 domain-containing protein [Marinobacter alexandrii]|uniref:DUF4145 domain-containing protein n=1 Tax=Marinobacter alexandrii TaxID=2570351 RepID=UPI0020000FEA|nr:DUF4145 domain-containing protein [Marinobacter alexandrii]MCK2149434.1 DUF4145 domain-containing protein [Marinobacter alexandrii]